MLLQATHVAATITVAIMISVFKKNSYGVTSKILFFFFSFLWPLIANRGSEAEARGAGMRVFFSLKRTGLMSLVGLMSLIRLNVALV